MFVKSLGVNSYLVHKEYKHSDTCIYLPPYKLDVLKIVEYKFSCEMEAHVEVTTSLMFDYNTFKDKRHLLILVAITLPSKELQFCNFINTVDQCKVGKDVFKRNCLSVSYRVGVKSLKKDLNQNPNSLNFFQIQIKSKSFLFQKDLNPNPNPF